MPRFASGALIVGATLFATTLHASVALARPGDDALTISKRANTEYKDGNFAEAAADYERAYHLKADPTLLFNLGRCYEALATRESFEKAVGAYESYLKEANAPTDAEALRRRIDSLREQIEILKKKDEPPPAPKPAPAPVPIAIDHGARPPPFIVLGTGLLLAGVGAGLAGGAAIEHGKAIDEPEGLAASDLQSGAKRFSTAANVCFGVGGAVALGGLVWGIVDIVVGRPKVVRDVRVTPLLGPGFIGVQSSF